VATSATALVHKVCGHLKARSDVLYPQESAGSSVFRLMSWVIRAFGWKASAIMFQPFNQSFLALDHLLEENHSVQLEWQALKCELVVRHAFLATTASAPSCYNVLLLKDPVCACRFRFLLKDKSQHCKQLTNWRFICPFDALGVRLDSSGRNSRGSPQQCCCAIYRSQSTAFVGCRLFIRSPSAICVPSSKHSSKGSDFHSAWIFFWVERLHWADQSVSRRSGPASCGLGM
jgi:hypothetical protein